MSSCMCIQPCIDDQNQEVATITAIKFRNLLHSRAGTFTCKYKYIFVHLCFTVKGEVDCGKTNIKRGLSFMELQQLSAKVGMTTVQSCEMHVFDIMHMYTCTTIYMHMHTCTCTFVNCTCTR